MLLQKINQACARMRQGNPTVADYRLILNYPRMAAMFMKKH
jgi:hypothetical protein